MMATLFKEVIDLSHELFNNMLGVSSTSMAAFWPLETHDRSSTNSQGQLSMASKMILMSEHISTHFDAPYHFDPKGLTADRYPLDKLILFGHLLDFTAKKVCEAITRRDFEAAIERSGRTIKPGTALLAWTGQDHNWGKPGFAKERPYVDSETALWLVDQGIALFGTDLIGIDDPDDWRWTTHTAFLKRGVPMVQQLCNLGALQEKEFYFLALPLKIRDSTGGPVRAVALVV
jgi:kynurenine formamidase